MAVDSLSAYGYSQYIANSGTTLAERAKPKKGNLCVDPKTGYAADWDPKLYDPDRKVKKDNTKRNIIIAGTTVATVALLFLSRGKIKNLPFVKNAGTWLKNLWTTKIRPFGQKVVDWFKGLFGKRKTPTPTAPTTPTVATLPTTPTVATLPTTPTVATAPVDPAKPITDNPFKRTSVDELKNIDLKHVRDSRKRNMVQDALDDLPTNAELEAYRRAHRYQPPTAEQAAAIRANNAAANRASAISRQVQNNVDDASLAALQRARAAQAATVTPPVAGTYADDVGNIFKLENGRVVEIRPAGTKQIITKPATIAKYETQLGYDPAKLRLNATA